MSAMARKLGIGRSTLYRKMKEYGLAVEAQAPGDNIPEAALAEAERREGAAA
jgi:hypothetical protein